MRLAILASSCALLAACFSKPGFSPSSSDGGVDGDSDSDSGSDGPPADATTYPLTAAALISVGQSHGCRVTSTGAMMCWGKNDHGQLGRDLGVEPWTGIAGGVGMNLDWVTVAAGTQHTCGIRMGKVFCWGGNDDRQASPTNAAFDLPNPTEVTGLPGVAARVYAGGFTTCAITVAKEAFCWGKINFQLTPTTVTTTVTRLGGTKKFIEIAIANDHACAIEDTGQVHCWGEAEQLQTGREDGNNIGDTTDLLFAAAGPITNTSVFTSLSAAHEATCGTTSLGKLVCWGSSNWGQLGVVPASGGYAFRIVDETKQWTRVAVGDNHVCAVAGGDVYCYGDNVNGALGNGQFFSRTRAITTALTGVSGVGHIAANFGFTCTVATDGNTTRCWGSNAKGELGNRKFSRKTDPAEVVFPPGVVVQSIVAGDYHTCALVGLQAYCWGLNNRNQTGASSGLGMHAAPVLASQSDITQLAAGNQHACGLVGSSSQIECWGDNGSHQLGSPTLSTTRTTVTVPAPATAWSHVAAGSVMTCGIAAGELKCWGLRPAAGTASHLIHNYGTLGGWGWLSISIGSDFAVGVVMDNGTPHLAAMAVMAKRCAAGLIANADQANPVEILSGTVVASGPAPRVAAAQGNGAHTCVHRLDGGGVARLTCFGPDGLDAIGAGSAQCGVTNLNTNAVSPEAPATSWAAVDANIPRHLAVGDHSCALTSGGRLQCWGANTANELGIEDPGDLPTEVSMKTWAMIAGGVNHTCGLDTAGRVFCWGENQYGQVGDNTSYEPSPVPSGL